MAFEKWNWMDFYTRFHGVLSLVGFEIRGLVSLDGTILLL